MSLWYRRAACWRWISVAVLSLGLLGILLSQPAEGAANGYVEVDATVECGVASGDFCSTTDSRLGVVTQGVTGTKERFGLTLAAANRPAGLRQDDAICINVTGFRPNPTLEAAFIDYGLCNPEPAKTPEPVDEDKIEEDDESR
jgi:hypothetical protein